MVIGKNNNIQNRGNFRIKKDQRKWNLWSEFIVRFFWFSTELISIVKYSALFLLTNKLLCPVISVSHVANTNMCKFVT